MSPPAVATPEATIMLVDHRHLPDTDGTVQNFQQQPQNDLLTSSLLPRLHQLYSDGLFAIGHDSGIYWRQTQPPLDGCKAPDWFFVPGVPPMLDGESRRSYVLWQEGVRPLIVMEFVSGDGSEEHDTTPIKGKFWVYEKAIGASYYAIFDPETPSIELYEVQRGRYVPVVPNTADRYPIEPLGVELGIWKGNHRNQDMPWLRFWDSATGEMLPSYEDDRQRVGEAERLIDDMRREVAEEAEQSQLACRQADEACRQAGEARQQAERLAAKLRQLAVDPEAA